MKNKKGFTLVELLAVMVILGILIIIMIPAVNGALNKGKEKISEINKKQIKEAVEVLVTEVISCDISDRTYAVFNENKNTSSCIILQNSLYSKKVITIENLKNNNYFKDDANNCSGSIGISVNENNYQINIDYTNLTCK